MASPPKDGCRIGSDTNSPRKAVPNNSIVRMSIRIDPRFYTGDDDAPSYV